jgi:hypothetical protein
MSSRQDHILRVLSSIAVGTMAFCLTVPAAVLFGALIVDLPEGHAFFSPQDAILILISIAAGATVGMIVGKIYYDSLGKKQDQ